MMLSKKASILTETTVFLILNLIYIGILIVFLVNSANSVVLMQEIYAKQIVLLINSAEPNSFVFLNMQDAIDEVRENWGEEHIEDIISVKRNVIKVQLTEKSSYEYSFFNDIEIKNKNIKYIKKGGKDEGFLFSF